MRFAAEIGAALTLLFSRVIAGVHVHDLLLEEKLDRLLDLNLVRARVNSKDILVLLLAQQRRFFRQRRRLDQIVGLVHERVVLSASCVSARSVTMILSKASNCSVFTSAAVARRTGFTLRAEREKFSSKESEI